MKSTTNILAGAFLAGMDCYEKRMAPFMQAIQDARGTDKEEEARAAFWEENERILREHGIAKEGKK